MGNCTDIMDSVVKLEFSRSVAVCIDPLVLQHSAALSKAFRVLLFQENMFNNKHCRRPTHVAESKWCCIIKWSELVMVLMMVGLLLAAQAGITKSKLPDSLWIISSAWSKWFCTMKKFKSSWNFIWLLLWSKDTKVCKQCGVKYRLLVMLKEANVTCDFRKILKH